MASDYLITITRVDRRPVHLIPGGAGERRLKEEIVARIVNVGVFRTEAHVRAVVDRAVSDVLDELKSEVMP